MNNNHTVLVINDAPEQLKVLASILGKVDYRVLTAESGNKGFEIARREQPDLIISDVMMPDGDGIALCQSVRADEKLRFTPILLISALRKDAESIVQGIKSGADDYIEVPYEPMYLVAKAAHFIERKRMQDTLRESESRFRNLIENLSDVITTVTSDGTIIYQSPSLENVFGYQPEEMVGKNTFNFIHTEDATKVLKFFRRSLQQTEAVSPIEYRFKHKDGSWRTVESVGKCFDDPINGVIAIVNSRDITAQRNAFKAQCESEERFKAQYKSLPIPTYTWKKAGDDFVLVDFNDEAEKVTHQKIGKFVGIKASEFFDDKPQIVDNLAQCFKERKNIQHQKSYQFKTTGESQHLDFTYIFVSPDMVMIHSRDITAQKQAEELLRESENRFRLVSCATNDALWDWDLATNAIWMNEGFFAMFGYSPDEVNLDFEFLNKNIHPDDKERVKRSIYTTIENKENYWSNEYRFRRADGSYSYVFDRGYVLYSNDGKPVRMIGAMMDITERKQAEEQLDHFFRVSADMLCFAGFDSYFKRVNPAWEKVLGYSEEEMKAKPFIDFVHPDDRDSTIKEIEKNIKGQNTVSFENRYQCKDGSYKWLLWNSATMPDEQMMYAVAHDITRRKESETALTEANERAIREYDRLLQRLSDLALTSGAARNLTTVFRAILNFASASVPCTGLFISLFDQTRSVRKGVYFWCNGKEENVSKLEPVNVGECSVEKAVESGEVIIIDNYQAALTKGPTTVRFACQEDAREPQSCLIAPMKIKANVIGTIEVQSYEPAAYKPEHATAMQLAANLVANAIENVQLLEQENQSAERLRLSERLESVGRLAGGIAHDFNNMLTAINGYSDLTLRRLDSDSPLRANIEEIKKAGERSALLTHQLLAFSRKQVLKPRVLELNQVVTEISEMLKRLIGEDIELITNLNPELGQVEADLGQLTQVIMNLAVNGRDAMPQGGELTIKTDNVYLDEEYAATHISTRPGSYVLLSVSDSGTGISEENQQYIFEPFYSTKEMGKGTGLGLATVYGIVKQSGGYIWVTSKINAGTTFEIFLPRVDEVILTENNDVIEHTPNGTEAILLVEDEDIVRSLSRQFLETCGYEVIEACNGVEAMSICEQPNFKIDLLMTDVVMPQMGGRELSEKLTRLYPQTRVLFTSGYTDDAVLRQGVIKMGANFIQKPFTLETLAKKVRELLDAETES